MKTVTISLFFVLLTFKSVFAQSEFIDKLRAESNVTGLQLVWIDKNKTAIYNSGLAYAGNLEKVKSTTIFQAASLSKVILAYICMQLVAEKKLSLDKPLYHYYDYPRMRGDSDSKNITARMVLNHTTGWPNWAQNPRQKAWGTSTLKTQFKPGAKWSYSGEGFVFLQLAIQSILKKDLQSIAKDRVFAPLIMKNSSFIWKNNFERTATYGFNDNKEPTDRTEYFSPNASFSLLTTATDYSLFLKALAKQHLLPMLNTEISLYDVENPKSNAKNLFWGLGLGIQKNELGKIAWHWGDNGDFKSFFIIHPERQQIVVCLTNSVNGLKLIKPLSTHFFGKSSWPLADWLN